MIHARCIVMRRLNLAAHHNLNKKSGWPHFKNYPPHIYRSHSGSIKNQHPRLSTTNRISFICTKRHQLSTASITKTRPDTIIHTPPFPVRVALVSSATALATPVFPAIGLVNAFLRIVLPEPTLRATFSGFLGTVTSFAFWTVIPNSYGVGPLLVPFAMGNGLCAGAAYAFVDVVSGGPKGLKNPILVGGGIGAFTGAFAPLYCYGPLFYQLYGVESIFDSIHALYQVPFMAQISVMTGFIAGGMMHPLLYFFASGVKGVPWLNFSGVALFATSLAAYLVYSPKDTLLLVTDEQYVPRKHLGLLNAVVRYNVEQGEFAAFSDGKWIDFEDGKKGFALAEIVRKYSDVTFDDAMLAVLYDYGFTDVAERNPDRVVKVMSIKDFRSREEAFLQTDWVVACINKKDKSDVLEELHTHFSSIGASKRQRKIQAMKDVSIAVELLFSLKQHDADSTEFMSSLEAWIRQAAPKIILYASDEYGDYSNQSVESQLQQLSWTGGDLTYSKSRWEHLLVQKREKLW
eukprot:CAMPEP_0172501990 /NCGR_PEP_ID=MMETSP1066-20121228/155578_1 /TAXON_ID=671091 /ORGANISM="Coscinodiscus wailesii, Strain CCMP2513" /LENGTH=516 /DNA_ID=CAMNT_0013277085 /DNA_START=71 /DNA_END=1618 /DNA_ORIENTATION=+